MGRLHDPSVGIDCLCGCYYLVILKIQFMQIGEIIKWKEGGKRRRFEVMDIDRTVPYSYTIRVRTVYFPAPKSKLNKRGVFSKFKQTITHA